MFIVKRWLQEINRITQTTLSNNWKSFRNHI